MRNTYSHGETGTDRQEQRDRNRETPSVIERQEQRDRNRETFSHRETGTERQEKTDRNRQTETETPSVIERQEQRDRNRSALWTKWRGVSSALLPPGPQCVWSQTETLLLSRGYQHAVRPRYP